MKAVIKFSIANFLILIAATPTAIPAIPSVEGVSRQSVWFSPESHYPPARDSDFLQLFVHPELWHDAAARIGVLKLSTQFYVSAPIPILRSVVSLAALYHMKLAVEAEVQCRGAGAFSPVNLAQTVVENTEKAGGTISAVSMDGALFTVIPSTGSGVCSRKFRTAATKVASVLSIYRNAFPEITIGDIVPVPAILRIPRWSDTMSFFYAALSSKGFDVAYVDVDFNWRDEDVTTTSGITQVDEKKLALLTLGVFTIVKRLGKELGFIIDGKANASSNKQWIDQAKQNFLLASKAVKPDRLVFQSWHSFPNALPDSSPQTFTGLIERFPQSP
jgi:hypothetical protein